MRSGQLVDGRYRLKEQVGKGGDGIVWRAVDERLRRVVAVKHALTEDDANRVRLLQREAEILAQLNHPNIVTIFDLVSEGVDWWLVMEYVASRSLAEQGTLPPGRAARIGAQIADALDMVHGAGVLHRDIKPHNVLLTKVGGHGDRAKLGDFGISRVVWADETLTDSGAQFIGTPSYTAPEVARGEADHSAASDVFALGATLFFAVEGVSPYGTAENPQVLLWRARKGAMREAEHAGALAPALSALLSPDPADRPTVAEAHRMLEEVAVPDATVPDRGGKDFMGAGDARNHLDPGEAHAHPPLVAGGPGPERPAQSRWRLVAVAGGAAAALVAGLVMYWPFGGGNASPPPKPPAAPPLAFDRETNPCAVADPAALARFGDTELATDYGNFDRCDVIVRSGHSEVDVKFELDTAADGEEPGPVERVGGLGVVREPGDGGECDRTVVMPDRSQVHVTAQQDEGHTNLCAIGDAATSHAVSVLSRGRLARRAARPNPASLINVDACGLLGAAALSRFPGVDALHPEPGFGGWSCTWNSTTDPAKLQLIFDRNEPLNASDGRPERLGGHQAFVAPDGYGDQTCEVSIVQRRYVDTAGEPTVELLLVVVTGPQPAQRRCALATALAAPAAAGLPHA